MDAFSKVFLGGQCTYKDVFTLTDGENFTHAIILNIAMPSLRIPKENVLGLAYEPREFLKLSSKFIEYAKKHIGKYCLGNAEGLPPPFTSHFSYMWFAQERPNYLKGTTSKKTGNIAIWASSKQTAPGHKYRHQLIDAILKTDLPIDIWGSGSRSHGVDKRIKGSFDDEQPYKNYRYCVSIENYQSRDYISEKFCNCLAFNTIPVYLGASNVKQYFGNSYIQLLGDIKKDMQLLENICKNPQDYVVDLSTARKSLFEGWAYLPYFIEQTYLKCKASP